MKNVKLTKDEKKKHTSIQEEIKKVVKTDKKVVSTVKLVTYTIKAIIPTGAYANIQPEITVSAESLEEAEAYVIPHINKLFEEFLNKSERRVVVPKVEVKETPAPVAKVENVKIPVDNKIEDKKEPIDPQKTNDDIARLKAGEPLHSIPYTKASNAINSCMSLDALEIIKGQVIKSEKLTDTEKKALLETVIPTKENDLAIK